MNFALLSEEPTIDPGLKSILCIGCSFTRSEEKRDWPFHLAQVLEGEPYLICQGGQSASGTWYHLALAKLHLIKPDMVICQIMEAQRNPQTMKEKRSAGVDRSFFGKEYHVWSKVSKTFNHRRYLGQGSKCYEILHDLYLVRLIKEEYECPFVYLHNKYEFPYNEYSRYVEGQVRKMCQEEDKFLVTSFVGDKFWHHQYDSHPNARRARLTAYNLANIIIQMEKKQCR